MVLVQFWISNLLNTKTILFHVVFTVSSVVLSFALGIIISLIYISTMKTLGKGFFLLMHSILIGFVILAILATSINVVIIFSILVVLISLLFLLALYKEFILLKINNMQLQLVFSIFISFLLILALILEVHNVKNIRNEILEVFRILIGALLLGGSLNAMLLGHWYLVQPGLDRMPIKKICNFLIVVLLIVTLGWLIKPSMLQVFSGDINDGWNGMLANMWLGSSITSLVILLMARKALSEKSYSAVMATTGLLYLVILMVAGVELIPRSIFS